jgi:hypothetical protein
LPDAAKWFPAIAVATLALFVALARRQCSVYLATHGLRIVRGKKEILVPMNQIHKVEREIRTDVSSGARSRTNTIIVTFREPTPLGRSIRFLAPFLHAQGLVDELCHRAGFVPNG